MPAGRILVVDDEPYMLRSLSFVLKKEGYEVETSSDGEDALVKTEEFRPDVIFLDLMMPGKDGYEVCHEIRNSPRFNGISPYIVILTCKGQDVDRYKGYLEGADEYVNKPFSPVDIAARMKEIFSGDDA